MLTCSELKKIPLFACLNNVNLVWLSQQAADLYLKPGEYLIHEGEPTPFFAVMEGSGIPRIGSDWRNWLRTVSVRVCFRPRTWAAVRAAARVRRRGRTSTVDGPTIQST